MPVRVVCVVYVVVFLIVSCLYSRCGHMCLHSTCLHLCTLDALYVCPLYYTCVGPDCQAANMEPYGPGPERGRKLLCKQTISTHSHCVIWRLVDWRVLPCQASLSMMRAKPTLQNESEQFMSWRWLTWLGMNLEWAGIQTWIGISGVEQENRCWCFSSAV